MIRYIKMKRNERKIKAYLYELAASFIDQQQELLTFIQKLYASLKDVPVDELRSELMLNIAAIAHAANKEK